MALSAKQQRFIDAFDGNGTAAARAAGYKGNDNTLAQVASENLRKPQIKKAIDDRAKLESKAAIANRQERQAYWTKTLRSANEETRDRLKASELLGRSEADFTEKLEVKGELTLEALVRSSYEKPEPS